MNGKFVKELVRLRAKPCSYLIYDGNEDKKAYNQKKCMIKKLKFEDNKNLYST